MKIIIISAIILLSSFQLFAQSDTDKVEQYAEDVATPRLLSSKETIDAHPELQNLLKETQQKFSTQKAA